VTFIDDVDKRIVHSPDGIVFSCFFIETMLRSSLSCLYSIACVNECRRLARLFGTAEDWASSTRFAVNNTIETMAYSMFIESWTSNASYEMFFNACAPSHCKLL
jgi:hypothetical protein